MSWAEVSARRLDRHGLASPLQDTRPADIAGTICGAHAQVMSAAELSIGLRLDGATRADVRHALWTERSLVKTYGPRGTVHLLPAWDLSMWTGALSALPPSSNGFAEGVRLTTEQTDEIVAAIAVALADAELTIDELSEVVIAMAGPSAGDLVMPAFQGMWPRWRQAITIAAHRGALCFGPNRGRKITYTNPRRWLPGFAPIEGQAALAEVVRRYLYAYGPATPQHFAQWLSAPRRWAAELFDGLSDELEEVEVDGVRAWQRRGDTVPSPTTTRGVRLLRCVYGWLSSPRVAFPQQGGRTGTCRGQAGNFPVLLIEGLVAGVWHQRRSGRKIDITVESFDSFTTTQRRELDDQIERLGRFSKANLS